MLEHFKIAGHFEVEHRRGGALLDRREVRNLVVSAGKALAAGLLIASGTAPSHLAIGTGSTAAAAGDTALQTEITTNGGQRAAATRTQVTTTVTNDTAQYAVTWTFTGSFAVTECGVLNNSVGGTLLARQVFSAINVVSGDTLSITYKVAVS